MQETQYFSNQCPTPSMGIEVQLYGSSAGRKGHQFDKNQEHGGQCGGVMDSVDIGHTLVEEG